MTSSLVRPLLTDGNDTFVRFNEAIPIIEKIKSKREPSFASSISSRKPFGLDTAVKISTEYDKNLIQIYAYPQNGYIEKSKVTQNKEWIDKYKVCISYAYGERGNFPYQVIGKPFIAPSGSCCTETYLVIRIIEGISEGENIQSYMSTKFFRFLVLLKKNTQHATKSVYEYVPNQDFAKPWTDEELYAKYGLTDSEIDFIESMIKPMDLNDGEGDDE